MRAKIIAVIAAFVLCAGNVSAEQRLHLGANSWHYTNGDTTNSEHNLIAYENNGWMGGYFKNSYDDDTVFFDRVWRKPLTKDIELTYSLGVNYGYHGCYGNERSEQTLCPNSHVGLTYTKYRFRPNIKIFGTAIVISTEIMLY